MKKLLFVGLLLVLGFASSVSAIVPEALVKRTSGISLELRLGPRYYWAPPPVYPYPYPYGLRRQATTIARTARTRITTAETTGGREIMGEGITAENSSPHIGV